MQNHSVPDINYMKQALFLAQKAQTLNEVPIGAVMVWQGKVIAETYNLKESQNCATHHAEILAIEETSKKLGRWRLNDCTLYVTLEPCPMCAGAIVASRIGRVVYGATDPKAGAVESLYKILTDPRLNHRPEITSGVLAHEAGKMLSEFFRRRRQERKNQASEQ